MRFGFKKFAYIFATVIVSIAICLIYGWYQIGSRPILSVHESAAIKIYPNSTIHDLIKQLEERRLIKTPQLLLIYARLTGREKSLRFGEYYIVYPMSVRDLFNNITRGTGLVHHQITFIEGWTFQQILNAVEKDENLRHPPHGQTESQIMADLGQPSQHPEGMFFPDTYTFVWGNNDIFVLKKSFEKMQKLLNQEWQQRANDLPYKNPYQALVVASLIEKETGLSEERKKIAGVIINRLKKGMRLQVDPTVLYGLGKTYDSPITKDDLETKTPYNTYRNYGLPPTPIAMPGLASLQAALHPETCDDLYYVSRGDGSHQFSKTYQEHLQAIAKYKKQTLPIPFPVPIKLP